MYESRVPAWQKAIANRLTADERSARKRAGERDLVAIARGPILSPFVRRALAVQLPAKAVAS